MAINHYNGRLEMMKIGIKRLQSEIDCTISAIDLGYNVQLKTVVNITIKDSSLHKIRVSS